MCEYFLWDPIRILTTVWIRLPDWIRWAVLVQLIAKTFVRWGIRTPEPIIGVTGLEPAALDHSANLTYPISVGFYPGHTNHHNCWAWRGEGRWVHVGLLSPHQMRRCPGWTRGCRARQHPGPPPGVGLGGRGNHDVDSPSPRRNEKLG